MTVDPFPYVPADEPDPDEEKAFMEAYEASLRDLCDWDPTPLIGHPIGMLHCPKCGCMILAGVAHPRCDPDFCAMADQHGGGDERG